MTKEVVVFDKKKEEAEWVMRRDSNRAHNVAINIDFLRRSSHPANPVAIYEERQAKLKRTRGR